MAALVSMDDDNAELLALLYTRIAALMEDTSVVALNLARNDDGDRRPESERMLCAVEQIRRLAAAARSLVE